MFYSSVAVVVLIIGSKAQREKLVSKVYTLRLNPNQEARSVEGIFDSF